MGAKYRCSTCGEPFKFRKDLKAHEKLDHQAKLSDFDVDGELDRLEAMMEALENNDYDVNTERETESSQRDLRNQRVRSKDGRSRNTSQKQLQHYR